MTHSIGIISKRVIPAFLTPVKYGDLSPNLGNKKRGLLKENGDGRNMVHNII